MSTTFDAKAATWDEEPRRRAMAMDVVAAIAQQIPLTPGQRLLDVGCGTGLIGLPLATVTKSVLGVDLSAGMIDRFTAKAQSAQQTGVRAEVRDLIASPLPPASIDVAVSAMAFHHIDHVDQMLHSIAGCLAPGGWLAVADLETEDGSFHGEPVPHLGFDPAAFLIRMQQAGLLAVSQARVHVMQKPAGGRSYPIFLAVARKP
ncbi:MAG TPA: class I SAM-dependent methyltransferase [Planctomycetes bacterium]|nr:class I SAM-dependent methyltransferase [Planctomycetota bacterium]